MLLFFLSSGLFLGWSLGANDAANVFGTAVGSRMISFARAALICSVFVIVGAVASGAGPSATLGRLGAVDALGGAFMAALAAGVTVAGMTRLSLPVSTSQAVVGAIIGWNVFTGTLTDFGPLRDILATWLLCPLLAGIIAAVLYRIFATASHRLSLHLLWEDRLTRWALIAVGAFGSYSLGANNIANVMGVFVTTAPFAPLEVPGLFTLTGAQQLFLLGGGAIALGVFTYSQRVMRTVGGSLLKLTPQMALVVVLAHAIVLFLFSSLRLEAWLLARGLPALPLVPVSSSQAVIGAVLGMGLLRGGRGLRFRVLGEIAAGWVTTPLLAGLVAFVGLFFLQNTFDVTVHRSLDYVLDAPVRAHLASQGVSDPGLAELADERWTSQADLSGDLVRRTDLDRAARLRVARAAERDRYVVTEEAVVRRIEPRGFAPAQLAAVRDLIGREFRHGWELLEELERLTPAWRPSPDDDPLAARRLRDRRRALLAAFRNAPAPAD